MKRPKQKIAFIINPISGGVSKLRVPELIDNHIDKAKFEVATYETKHAGHAREIVRTIRDEVDIVVAVGGDGTVNEISKELVNTGISLGIVPMGSGNGLARHLKIPLRADSALTRINRGRVRAIDTVRINEGCFVNVSGVGFDAHVSHQFAKEKERGAQTYWKVVFREFIEYKPKKYNITVDGKKYTSKAFLIAFANSSQWGNNINIAPDAIIDDGLIDVCIIKRFPKPMVGFVGVSLLMQMIHKTKYDQVVRGKRVEVSSKEGLKLHIDGEPVAAEKEVSLEVLPASLRVIT